MCQQDSQFLTKREGEKGEGTVTSYEACRIRFHAVSFLVIGTDGVVVHQGREFNRTRWNIILSQFRCTIKRSIEIELSACVRVRTRGEGIKKKRWVQFRVKTRISCENNGE